MQLTTTHKLDAASSAVHAVTIFQSDCAEVVRKFAITLKVSYLHKVLQASTRLIHCPDCFMSTAILLPMVSASACHILHLPQTQLTECATLDW
jgi:hypothetical protein